MEYTFGSALLLNIPLVLAEYKCCILLTFALTKKTLQGKRVCFMFIPYSLLIIIPASLFFVQSLFENVIFVIIVSYLETAGWTIALKVSGRETWERSLVTGAMAVFLYGVLDELGGFFLQNNFNLKIPRELLLYMVSTMAAILVFGIIVSGIILKIRLYEVYNSLLFSGKGTRFWKAVIILLPALKTLSVEAVNEHLILNNSNPMISLLFLLLVIGGMNYAFRCDIQSKQLQEQQASLEQQKLYIQNLESVQRDVRAFRHDFKNRMAGIRIQADDGDLNAVQNFIAEVTGDFERKVGEKIFQISQLGNIRITELKGLVAVKASEMQQRAIPFRLEAAAPVTYVNMPVGDLCRAAGILLDNAMEETEKILQSVGEITEDQKEYRVTALFCAEESGVSIVICNPVKEPVPISKIWEDGYSTKGSGRGIGLASLRRIVEMYDNISSRTYQEDGLFIQELNIRTGVSKL